MWSGVPCLTRGRCISAEWKPNLAVGIVRIDHVVGLPAAALEPTNGLAITIWAVGTSHTASVVSGKFVALVILSPDRISSLIVARSVVPLQKSVYPCLPPILVVEHVVHPPILRDNVLIILQRKIVILSLMVMEDGMKVKSVI